MHRPVSRRKAVALLSGAAAAPLAARAAGGATPGERLAQVFKDSDDDGLRLVPLNATWRGDRRYAGQYGDLITDGFMRAFEAYARKDLVRIRRVDRAALSPVEQVEYDVFEYQTRFTIRSYETGAAQANAQDFALDHLNGAQIMFPQSMAAGAQYDYAGVADYEAALKLHAGFAVFLDRAIVYMRCGLKRGNIHIRVIVERMIGQMREAVAAGVDGSPFLTPTAAYPSAVPQADWGRLTAAYRASIEAKVIPACERLLRFLETEYLPRARLGAPGLGALPGGPALYRYLLELYTTTTLTPEEIHATGLSEVARIRIEMERVKRQVGFQGDLAAFFAHLKTDAKFKFATKEAYLARFGEIWDRVRPLLPRYFETVPKTAFEVRPVPAEMESATGGAYYVPGPPDGSRPGIFYVNTSNLPTRTSPNMTALFLHEAQPGHHFQAATASENAALPAFLRFLWNSGYTEGWGLYAERLGIEMGVYDDPYQYFGMLDLEMFRATRLVIDTGLHAKGWSRDQAIAYMADNTSLDRDFIVLEIDRYIVTPGQATSYKVGELMIRRLRRRAETALGGRFDAKAFHAQVLGTGSIPLRVLEQKIDHWIVNQGRA